VRERELAGRRELVALEPPQLDEVVARSGLAGDARGPGQAEDDAAVVGLEPVTEKVHGLDLERRLLADLAPERLERRLVLVQEPARKIPQPLAGIEGAPAEQHSAALVEAHRLGARHRVGVCDVAARTALGALFDLLDSLAADGAETPTVQCAHRAHDMSPRAVGATQHELSRIGLLATLPGETLGRLAQRMTREDVAAGAGLFAEGDDGDRFYVVLNGMLTVSQETRGPQGILRPGDYFGEVALAMGMPRTASVRALTPATVASCDKETFDEFIRPLFADDG
jgi:hypothetical protein